MTKQEYYDLLVQSATDGTFPSIEENVCQYRTGSHKCAVGLLIPEDKYYKGLEGLDVYHASVSRVVEVPEGLTIKNLTIVQVCHDNLAFDQSWNAEEFLNDLNKLQFFQDIKQHDI